MKDPRPSSALVWLAWITLGILSGVIVLGEVGVAQTSFDLALRFPEFAHLQEPLMAAAISFGVCLVALLAVSGVLVGCILADRIFDPPALRLVDALVAITLVATAIVAVTLPEIPGPPILAVGMMVGVLVGLTIALVLLVLRSLLRRAASMRLELDEVV